MEGGSGGGEGGEGRQGGGREAGEGLEGRGWAGGRGERLEGGGRAGGAGEGCEGCWGVVSLGVGSGWEDFLPAGFWTEGGPEAAAEEVAGAATTLEGVRSAVGMAMIWTPMPPVGTSGTPGTAAPGGETAAAAPGGPLAAPRACPGEPAGQTVTVTGAAPLEQRLVLPF